MKREGIENVEAYDEKYAIHYKCQEWMPELLALLKKDGKDELHQKETGAAGRMFLHGTLLSDAITELSVPEVSTAVNR